MQKRISRKRANRKERNPRLGHRWTREEAQRANAARLSQKATDPKLYTESRKNPSTGRYEYLVNGRWVTRQAVYYLRLKERGVV